MSNVVKGVLSFPQLFEPRAAVQGSEPRFSVQVFLRPDDPQIAQVKQQIEKAAANTWPSGSPPNIRYPLQAYDEKYGHKDYYDPKLSGWWVLTCNAKQNDPPAVVNEQRQSVIDRGDVYPGCVAHVAYNVSAYNNAQQGVGAFLNGVMVTKEDPPLGRLDGKASVEQMFSQTTAAAPPPAAPPSSGPKVTAKAEFTYEKYRGAGWTDTQLLEHGLIEPPAAAPSFGG